MYCICCNENKVCPKDKSSRSEEDILLDKSKPSTDLIFIDGVVETINAGYGSKHDGYQFLIALCDDCISNKLEDGTLLFKNDYMFTNQDFIKEQVDKSKKIYRRRINLDSLIK